MLSPEGADVPMAFNHVRAIDSTADVRYASL